MKKAAVLISIILAVCLLAACDRISDKLDTENISSVTSKVSSPETDAASDNTDTASESDTESESKNEESKKNESDTNSSEKNESKKNATSSDERGDSIPSRSDEYEATPQSKAASSKKSDTESTATDTATDTDTGSDAALTDTDTEEKPEPPYLSGLWIVEKILDSDGKEVDGRDIYGSAFNYAGVLDLNEEIEFKLTIGIIPEGQINEGLYEQRGDVLVLQYNDADYTQIFLDVTTLDGMEVLALPVTVGGKDYTIYFSR